MQRGYSGRYYLSAMASRGSDGSDYFNGSCHLCSYSQFLVVPGMDIAFHSLYPYRLTEDIIGESLCHSAGTDHADLCYQHYIYRLNL